MREGTAPTSTLDLRTEDEDEDEVARSRMAGWAAALRRDSCRDDDDDAVVSASVLQEGLVAGETSARRIV
jgi:sirohydrochlorin ferrochelatase